MHSLVVGNGEVGTSLGEVLGCEVLGETTEKRECDVLHICFPYSYKFGKEVKRYQQLYNPKYTIVHSTVPIGCCQGLGVYHSPIRGMHPNLAQSIKTFVTYLAPENRELKNYLESYGMKIELVKKPRNTEALKLFDTTYYLWNILFEKMLYAYCKEYNLDYQLIYKKANETYNEGYVRLGKPEVQRPVLKHIEGKVGGHCIIPNAEMLEKSSEIAKLCLNLNEAL